MFSCFNLHEFQCSGNSFKCIDKGQIKVLFECNSFEENKIQMLFNNSSTDLKQISSVLKQLKCGYSIIVFDEINKTICAARDVLGLFPLYYGKTEDRIAFATQINNLFEYLQIAPEVNSGKIHEYMTFRYISGEETIYKNIYEVPPGILLIFENNSHNNVKKVTFSVLNYQVDQNVIDEKYAVESFKNCFEKAYTDFLMLQQANNVGVLSSGGIDSSILVALTSKNVTDRINTFYVGNKQYKYDRNHVAAQIGQLFDTNHEAVFVSGQEYADNLIECIIHNEEPLDHPSSIYRHVLYKRIKNKATILISGEGADCLFCGYHIFDTVRYSYVYNSFRNLTKKIVSIFPLQGVPENLRSKVRKIRDAFLIPPDEYSILNELLAVNDQKKIGMLLEDKQPLDFLSHYFQLFKGYNRKNILNKILEMYQTYYLQEGLRTLYKLGCASNIEHYHPFANIELVNLFNSFPWHIKKKYFVRKPIIHSIAKEYIPSKILKLKKEGFGVPLKQYFSDSAAMGMYCDILTDKKTLERGIFNRKSIQNIITQITDGSLSSDEYETVVWPIINFELWYRNCIEGKKRCLHEITI